MHDGVFFPSNSFAAIFAMNFKFTKKRSRFPSPSFNRLTAVTNAVQDAQLVMFLFAGEVCACCGVIV